jgi:flagellar hook assembly protein FlgD
MEFGLSQNYPNPFNPTTSIKFAVPELGNVRIAIYDMLGQEVRTLVSEQMDRGTRIVEWNGLDNNSVQVTSGMYIYRMTAGDFIQSHKMMLLK